MKRKFCHTLATGAGDSKEGEPPEKVSRCCQNLSDSDSTIEYCDGEKDTGTKEQCSFGSPPDSAYSSFVKTPLSPPPSTSTGYCSSKDGGTPQMYHFDWVLPLKAPYLPKIQTEALRVNFKLFKNEIEPNNNVSDKLYQSGFIQDTDLERIKAASMPTQRADVLIKALARSKKATEFGGLFKIQRIFAEAGYDYLQEHFILKDKDVTTVPEMEIDREEIIRRLYLVGGQLEADLEPKFIIDDMLQNGALTFNDHQDILDTDFRPDRVCSLVKYVLADPTQNFPILCNALHEADLYPEIEDTLVNGTIDPNINDFVPSYKLKLALNDCFVEQNHQQGACQNTEIKFNFGGKSDQIKDVEMAVVDENTQRPSCALEAEAMEIGFSLGKIHFSSIRIHLKMNGPNSQQKLVLACRDKMKFVSAWMEKLLDSDAITKLRNAHADEVTVTVTVTRASDETGCCPCMLTKEAIVENFSLIEQEMPSVDDLLPAFLNFDGISNETKLEFSAILNTPVEMRKNEFLLKLLRMNDKYRMYCCLFAKELKRLGKAMLIEKITQQQHEIAVNPHVLSVRDIKRNYSLLVKEIEPKQFIAVLQSDQLAVDKILKATNKTERASLFLDFVMSQGKKCVKLFVQELERLNMTDLLGTLKGSALAVTEGLSNLKRNMLANYGRIITEIEPRVFRKTFIERRILYAKDFDVITKLRSRQDRAIALLKLILKNGEPAMQCLVDALRINEYDNLVDVLTKVADDNAECPLLAETNHAENCLVFTAKFDVQYKAGGPGESDLQTYIHKLLYSNKEGGNADMVESVIPDSKVNKTEQIQQWCNSIKMEDGKRESKRRWSETLNTSFVLDDDAPEMDVANDGEPQEKKARLTNDAVPIVKPGLHNNVPFCTPSGNLNPFFNTELMIMDDSLLTPGSAVSSADSTHLRHDEAASVGTSQCEFSRVSPFEDISPAASPLPLSPSVVSKQMMTNLDVEVRRRSQSHGGKRMSDSVLFTRSPGHTNQPYPYCSHPRNI